MGARGPRANTDQENDLKGNPGKRKSKNKASRTARGIDKIPKAPKGFSKLAKLHWEKLATVFFESGKLTEENITILEMACKNYAIWHEYEKIADEYGRIYVAQSGYRQIDASVTISKDAEERYRKCLKILRETHPVMKKKGDPLDRFPGLKVAK